MSKTIQIYSVTETPHMTAKNICLDLAGKFRIYRMGVESKEIKLKNADAIIEQLKDEISFSRDSEKNLRKQLSSAQNRLIHLQETFKKLITASEQQRQHEKIFQQIEQRVEKISETLKQTREESQNLLKQVSREEDLLRKIENMKSVLAMKDREYDLMKMEIQALTAAKKNLETTSNEKLANVEKELEKLKQREIDAKVNFGETLAYYQNQLEEKEQTIKLYKKERMHFLDNFEPIKVSEIGCNDFKSEENTISINSPERSLDVSTSKRCKSQTEPKESNMKVFLPSPSSHRSKLISLESGKNENCSEMPKNRRPQLEFLMASQDPPIIIGSVKRGQKRRLFSTDCNNHYTD